MAWGASWQPFERARCSYPLTMNPFHEQQLDGLELNEGYPAQRYAITWAILPRLLIGLLSEVVVAQPYQETSASKEATGVLWK